MLAAASSGSPARGQMLYSNLSQAADGQYTVGEIVDGGETLFLVASIPLTTGSTTALFSDLAISLSAFGPPPSGSPNPVSASILTTDGLPVLFFAQTVYDASTSLLTFSQPSFLDTLEPNTVYSLQIDGAPEQISTFNYTTSSSFTSTDGWQAGLLSIAIAPVGGEPIVESPGYALVQIVPEPSGWWLALAGAMALLARAGAACRSRAA